MVQKPFFILLSALFLLLVLVSAEMPSQNSQIRARVDLVVVPVSVRDNNNFLIPGLEREDFSIFEDGKRQEITNFSNDPHLLSAAIVIDDGVYGNTLRQVVALLPSLTAAFETDDEMTSFRYDHFVWRLSDFTSDDKQIEQSFRELAEIAETRPAKSDQPELYRKIEKKTPAIIRAIAGLFSIGGPGGAPGGGPAPAPAPKPVPTTRTMHTAVYEAAMSLRDRAEDRRKIILLVSDGTVSERQIGVVPLKTLHSFNSNVDLLLKNEIEVYSVYTPGTLLESAGGMLDAYARATGGDVYGGQSESDMKFAFGRIAEQARTQYVLGYVSNNTAPALGVYRKIEVKSGDPDQKRKATHRQGYTQYPIPK